MEWFCGHLCPQGNLGITWWCDREPSRTLLYNQGVQEITAGFISKDRSRHGFRSQPTSCHTEAEIALDEGATMRQKFNVCLLRAGKWRRTHWIWRTNVCLRKSGRKRKCQQIGKKATWSGSQRYQTSANAGVIHGAQLTQSFQVKIGNRQGS